MPRLRLIGFLIVWVSLIDPVRPEVRPPAISLTEAAAHAKMTAANATMAKVKAKEKARLEEKAHEVTDDAKGFATAEAQDMPALVVIAVLKHEVEYMHHWIDYHLHVGVTHMILIPNECDDEAHAAVMKVANHFPHKVTVFDAFRCAGAGFQTRAYREAVQYFFGPEKRGPHNPMQYIEPENTRVAFIDADEFLVGDPLHAGAGRGVSAILADEYPPEAREWLVATRAFGSSGRERKPRSGSVPANFVLRFAYAGRPADHRFRGSLANGHLRPSLAPLARDDYDNSTRTPADETSGSSAHRDLLVGHVKGTHGKVERGKGKHVSNPASNNHLASPKFRKAICLLSAMIENADSIHGLHRCFKDAGERGNVSSSVWLNHYVTKSDEELQAKVARGRADISAKRDWNTGAPATFSEVPDLWALVFLLRTCAATDATCWKKNASHPTALGELFDHDDLSPDVHDLVAQWCIESGDLLGRVESSSEKAPLLAPGCGLLSSRSTSPTQPRTPCDALAHFGSSFCNNAAWGWSVTLKNTLGTRMEARK